MNNNNKGALLMLASAFAFAIMQIAIAITAGEIPLFEQLFFRNFIAAIIAFFAIRKKAIKPFGKFENQKLLIARSSFGFIGMMATFYASGAGEQGDVTTILKMSPFVVTVLAYFFLKEKITKFHIIGLIVACTGAFFIGNPQFNSNAFPVFIAFVSCIFAGIAYTLVASLKGKEEPEVIIFYFSFFSTIGTIPGMFFDFKLPNAEQIVLLLLIGIFAAIGQITLTYSYAIAKASDVSVYNYMGILFSIVLGYIFLGQSVKTTSIIGAVLVVFAGLIVFFGNKSLVKED